MPDRKIFAGSALEAPVRRRAHPLFSLHRYKSFQIERLLSKKHVEDGSAELGGQDAQAFALPVFLLDASKVLGSRGIPSEKQSRSFREGPLEVGVAHLASRGFRRLAGGLMPSLDQARIGQKVLHAFKALQVIDLVKQSQSQNLSNPGDGPQERELVPVILPDFMEQVELEISDDLVVSRQQSHVGRHGHLHAALVEVFDDGSSVLSLVDPFLEGREVVLGVGVLNVREQLAPLADKESAAAHEVAGSSLLSRIDIGVREVSSAQQGSDLVGVDPVVLGLAAMDSLHLESMAEDELDALFVAEVGDPIPAEEALDSDSQVLAVGFEGPEELVSVAVELPVDEGFAFLVEDAEIQAPSVEVDAAVVTMLLGIESHGGLLSDRPTKPTAVAGWRGPQPVSQRLERTADAAAVTFGANLYFF